jgi:hypothetical protein
MQMLFCLRSPSKRELAFHGAVALDPDGSGTQSCRLVLRWSTDVGANKGGGPLLSGKIPPSFPPFLRPQLVGRANRTRSFAARPSEPSANLTGSLDRWPTMLPSDCAGSLALAVDQDA